MDSAVHRTPPELWTEIFKVSTSWLLLPIRGNNLSNLSYNIQDCEHIHGYISSLVIRTRLRRVCRSWKAVIESMTDHLVISDLSGTYWPSTRYISTSSFIDIERDYLLCACGPKRLLSSRKDTCEMLLPSDLPSVSTSKFEGEYPQFSEPLIARVLHLRLHDAKTLPYTILEKIPSLQVLCWTPCVEDDICGILRRFTGLTHLSLILDISQAPQCSGHLDLPSVEYLHLAWCYNYRRTEDDDSFSKWNMPNLTVLKMTGSIDTATMNELDIFISKVRHSITGLLLDLVVEFDIQIGNTRIWKSCPNLSILGVSIYWFASLSFIPHGLALIAVSNPLTIYISSLDRINTPEYALQIAFNLVKWCQEHPCTISRIAIARSWKHLARQIYNIARPIADEETLVGSEIKILNVCMREFFGELGRSNIPICDCEEVLFEGDEATWFREGLYSGFTADILR